MTIGDGMPDTAAGDAQSGNAPTMESVNLANVQGLVHEFYPCECSRYLLYRFQGASQGKAFLRALTPLVTVARADVGPGAKLLNVGISFAGLEALQLDPEVLREFPLDFRDGPIPTVMGDYGDSAPEHWWHGRFTTSFIHALVHLACHSGDEIAALTDQVQHLADGLATELVPTPDDTRIDGRHLGNGRLHFGYRDGISQPDVAWSDTADDTAKTNFRHFILGYSTREFASSPNHKNSRPRSGEAVELARDGSYAVLKWIYQDVARFNLFLETEGTQRWPDLSPKDAQELLAAKLMGRWRDGTPLVLSSEVPQPELASSNDFNYASTDPDGVKCPFAAHIRVVNPRDQELNPPEKKRGVPRVIRRGTPFGPPLEGNRDDGKLRGLVGVFLCTSIRAQVYKLTEWMQKTNFSPKFTNLVGQDPLASRNVPNASTTFDIPSSSGKVSVTLADFTKTLGTAFFLVPGLSGLRQIARE